MKSMRELCPNVSTFVWYHFQTSKQPPQSRHRCFTDDLQSSTKLKGGSPKFRQKSLCFRFGDVFRTCVFPDGLAHALPIMIETQNYLDFIDCTMVLSISTSSSMNKKTPDAFKQIPHLFWRDPWPEIGFREPGPEIYKTSLKFHRWM